ncbi:hypothetical protein F4778DRAFT_713259 [Xylariomycetidae sp. FL2044]|nr:hypothetical protein F4778DRAFT_713259 [Xylariomycetidae sp. FL2044]
MIYLATLAALPACCELASHRRELLETAPPYKQCCAPGSCQMPWGSVSSELETVEYLPPPPFGWPPWRNKNVLNATSGSSFMCLSFLRLSNSIIDAALV